MAKTSGNPAVQAETDPRAARLARAAATREQRERKAKRARIRNLSAIGVVVVLAIVAGVVLATRNSSDTAAAPAGLTAGQGIKVGSGPVDITVWEDFQCPACKSLEDTAGADLTKVAAAGGGATVTYIPISILDRQSNGNEYSTRAANAAYCAPADKRKAFHDKLYANQPEEGTNGMPDDRLIALAGEAGVTGTEFADCVKNRSHADFVASQTALFGETMEKAKAQAATPGVFVNGKWVSGQWSAAGFFPAIVAQEGSGSSAPATAPATTPAG